MMKKIKYIWLVLLILAVFSASITATSDDEYFAGTRLKQLGVLKGYPDGTLKLENTITRSEVATIMVRIRGYETEVIDLPGKAFTDVAGDFWAANYIQNAYKLGIIQGYPEGAFKPANSITYAEVVAIMVGTLGFKDQVTGDWPYNYINMGKELGVIPQDSTVDPGKIITRGEMSLIVWDTLLVKLEDTSILQ